GVHVVRGVVRRVVSGDDGHVTEVELLDGERIDVDAVVVGPRFRARIEPFTSAGVRATAHESGLGDVIAVDAMGATEGPGSYAAGNVTGAGQQVLHAAAHGSRVGGMVAFSLAHEDLRTSATTSANERDWEHRYSGEQIWSGRPNGSLVAEIEGVAPGRALDVG